MSKFPIVIDEEVSVAEQIYLASAVQRAYHMIWELQKREEFLKDTDPIVRAAVGLLRRKTISDVLKALFDNGLLKGSYDKETILKYTFEVFRLGRMKFTLNKVTSEGKLPPVKDYRKQLCLLNGGSPQLTIFNYESEIAKFSNEFYSILTYGHFSRKGEIERPSFVCFTVPTHDYALHSNKNLSNLLLREAKGQVEEITEQTEKKLLTLEFREDVKKFVESKKKKMKSEDEDK